MSESPKVGWDDICLCSHPGWAHTDQVGSCHAQITYFPRVVCDCSGFRAALAKLSFLASDLEGLRAILCLAQEAQLSVIFDSELARITYLIEQIDLNRPLDPDGSHTRHTPFCGCKERP